MLEIAEPFRRNERNYTDDRVAYGENTPQHADGLGITNVIGRVHVRGFYVLDLGTHPGVVAKSIVDLTVNANKLDVSTETGCRKTLVLSREIIQPLTPSSIQRNVRERLPIRSPEKMKIHRTRRVSSH